MPGLTYHHQPRWDSVERLAERLDIEPLDDGARVDIAIHSGTAPEPIRRYDLVALIEAVLDRLDAAAEVKA